MKTKQENPIESVTFHEDKKLEQLRRENKGEQIMNPKKVLKLAKDILEHAKDAKEGCYADEEIGSLVMELEDLCKELEKPVK